MKILNEIIIECSYDCPFYIMKTEYRKFIYFCKKYQQVITKEKEFPTFCKLKDYEY